MKIVVKLLEQVMAKARVNTKVPHLEGDIILDSTKIEVQFSFW